VISKQVRGWKPKAKSFGHDMCWQVKIYAITKIHTYIATNVDNIIIIYMKS